MTTVNALENHKSPEVLNFEKAIKSLSNPENLPSEEELRNQKSLKLSDRRKDILIPSALELIKSSGASERQIRNQAKGDRELILKWAVKIYNEKRAKNNQTL
ncbi:hypothetical protein [Chryseobacterium hagamense]|uniref:Uncharacterized protein n=1 Tax=Chryseobacterium hagamense TaxID=395935 RepID=A0A511YSN0_9FLAO|nr:hypothetical protein [Chryseobacterium hagamense]GEN78217.1 hypothetical protein CHA01nite_39570 [Chryseobacterium hagamense]